MSKITSGKTSREKCDLISHSAFSEKPEYLKVSEDSFLEFNQKNLFGVADGFGGAQRGDKASKKVLEEIKFFVQNGLGDSEVTLPFVYRSYLSEAANLLFNAFLFANQNLCAENAQKNIQSRAGCSAIVSFFHQGKVTLASAGCCSAFLFRQGKAKELVMPRSFQSLLGNFDSNPALLANDFPLSAIGLDRTFEPEFFEFVPQDQDILILTTDGSRGFFQKKDFAFSDTFLTAMRHKLPMQATLELEAKKINENNGLLDIKDSKTWVTLVFGEV